MTIEEAVLEKLRELPADKQAEVLDFVEFLLARSEPEPNGAPVAEAETPAEGEAGHASMRWVRGHRAEYLGRWVALEGERLLAAGEDGRAVYEAARGRGLPVRHGRHRGAGSVFGRVAEYGFPRTNRRYPPPVAFFVLARRPSPLRM
jgi:hypothetical protein